MTQKQRNNICQQSYKINFLTFTRQNNEILFLIFVNINYINLKLKHTYIKPLVKSYIIVKHLLSTYNNAI